MSEIISYTSHDYTPITAVPVIASFDSCGHIAPLYVRISGQTYKIHSYWTNSRFRGQMEFHCKIVDNDMEKTLLLTYYKAEDVWGLPRSV